MSIKKNYIIAKRNVLNELRANNMTLQELRFFSIYLSKINSKDLSTRNVRFPLSEFQKIMELDRLKIDYLKHVTDSLLCKIVRVPLNEKGGYTAFQLFKRCKVDTDESGEWYVEIDAHDDALPLMFEFKNQYFTYQLWNALRLKSSNQLRMYEILKQYEKVGERIISVDELKELLGINKNDYTLFNNFKKRVLDGCQEALKAHTDIQFSYEPTGKRGKGGKINTLKFTITKNDRYINQLSLEDFMDLNPVPEELIEDEITPHQKLKKERFSFFSQACHNEFSLSEIGLLYDIIIDILSPSALHDDIQIYHYYQRKYSELLNRAEQTKITHRFSYLKKIIESDL